MKFPCYGICININTMDGFTKPDLVINKIYKLNISKVNIRYKEVFNINGRDYYRSRFIVLGNKITKLAKILYE